MYLWDTLGVDNGNDRVLLTGGGLELHELGGRAKTVFSLGEYSFPDRAACTSIVNANRSPSRELAEAGATTSFVPEIHLIWCVQHPDQIRLDPRQIGSEMSKGQHLKKTYITLLFSRTYPRVLVHES